jgi:hypothetical protein
MMGLVQGGRPLRRETWWNGEGNEPTLTDEVGIIASAQNGAGYRPDDHGDSMESASAFSDVNGSKLTVKGVIGKLTDRDYFKFTLTQSGIVDFNLDPALEGWMLDAVLELRDANDQVIATKDAVVKGERIQKSLNAGTYYLVVKSHGRYGDLGQYEITGSVPYGTVSSAGPSALGGEQNIYQPVLGVPRQYSGASASLASSGFESNAAATGLKCQCGKYHLLRH